MLTKSSSGVILQLRNVITDLTANQPLKAKEPDESNERHKSTPFPLNIPHELEQLEQEEYPDVKFWTQDEWQDYCNNANEVKVKKLDFLCNKDGNPVTANHLKAMTDTTKKLWGDLYRFGYDPITWRYVGKTADEYYSRNMRISYLEFALCVDNWKAHTFATV
jgi:hypothetical protein